MSDRPMKDGRAAATILPHYEHPAAGAHCIQGRGDWWEVRCNACPTFVWDETEDGAIAKWNACNADKSVTLKFEGVVTPLS